MEFNMMKKLLYLNIDGFSYSYFERLMREDPRNPFARLAEQGMLFTNVRSGLVSITNPMQSAILCGAWSNRTHNFYQHYDWNLDRPVKHKRTFDAENIAQLFIRQGKTAVSIHQFMLENNPCQEGNRDCAYIKSPKEKSNAFDRLDILVELISGRPVPSGQQQLIYEEFPDFVAVYVDDIDSLGHNNAYEQYPKREKFEERQQDIMERLTAIGNRLLDVVALTKEKGLFDDLVFLITTDHGMTPFFGASRLDDILERLRNAGIRADRSGMRTEKTRVIGQYYTVELSLYCAPDITEEEKQIIARVCREAPYVDRVFDKAEMQRDFGFDTRGPDFLVSPKWGEHFYHRDLSPNTFGAGHDSFHETSQHVFGMILGPEYPAGSICPEQIYSIDFLPTLLDRHFAWKMKDQTGTVWKNW